MLLTATAEGWFLEGGWGFEDFKETGDQPGFDKFADG